MYLNKVNFLSFFTSAHYGHIDSIDFLNMYTRTHKSFFIQLAIAVFSTRTRS